ncbi:heterocyst formation protein HetP-like protein [Nostoc sp. MBR 210]|uniref:HetP family heterocyst commitment protein n=1 Tax=Nostoc spongiaeforme FACHB-130 TaxID=1357510 RepID=A0ABR8FPP2_9NOSO|nr:HetP family heterocyst commitment protein [Nostoc spongiaeforme]MBD2593434.1 HetP family heterocyst commitment protein [Nostoc spongiaeforme FACHB-130]OCQ92973.1 heterocyst formation protein HetP-like protein [Nostoc sp. MBR 210]
MNYQVPSSQNNCHSLITPEQLDQVIEAITDGRYSWACVLILRFIGYNPLHFMPQRTYSRLIKEQNQYMTAKNSDTTVSSSINKTDIPEKTQNIKKSNSQDKSDIKSGNIPGMNVLYLKSNMSNFYSSKDEDIQN